MSISGKCDFQDTCDIFGEDHIINNYKIYMSRCIVPLYIKSKKDLVPFYPYLVPLMFSSKDEGGTIYLSDESFIDREERETLESKLKWAKKYWRRCKRKKIPFDIDECANYISIFSGELEKEIAGRVNKHGEKATIDGLHDGYHDRMRKELYDEMINVGWDENTSYKWCYGLDRFYEKLRKEKAED